MTFSFFFKRRRRRDLFTLAEIKKNRQFYKALVEPMSLFCLTIIANFVISKFNKARKYNCLHSLFLIFKCLLTEKHNATIQCNYPLAIYEEDGNFNLLEFHHKYHKRLMIIDIVYYVHECSTT